MGLPSLISPARRGIYWLSPSGSKCFRQRNTQETSNQVLFFRRHKEKETMAGKSTHCSLGPHLEGFFTQIWQKARSNQPGLADDREVRSQGQCKYGPSLGLTVCIPWQPRDLLESTDIHKLGVQWLSGPMGRTCQATKLESLRSNRSWPRFFPS